MKISPIGIIYSPFKCKKDTPIQPFKSKAQGKVKVFMLIYKFHKSKGFCLKVKPFLDDSLRGVFATRYPRRPNQIGLTVVKLLKRKGNILLAKGIDIIDGTPLIDIKPYVPDFGPKEKIKIGWLRGKLTR